MEFLIGKEEKANREKLSRLYQSYQQRLFYFAVKILGDPMAAEDAVQDTFLRARRNLDHIDEEDSHKTGAFLYIIVEHIAYDYLKKRKSLLIAGLALCLFNFPILGRAEDCNTKILVETPRLILQRMEYLSTANAYLTIDSTGKATVKCQIVGYRGTTSRIQAKVMLQQYANGRWASIREFSESTNFYQLIISESHRVSRGYAYRVLATIKSYRGSDVESKTITSSSKYY